MRTLREILQPGFPVLKQTDTYRAFLSKVDSDALCPDGTPVPVVDETDGRLLGHIRRPGIEELMSSLDTPVDTALQAMVTLRSKDSLVTAWRRMKRHNASVMSLVDDAGCLLGTVCMPELQHALLDSFALNTDCVVLFVEKNAREFSLREIIQCADAERVQILGIQQVNLSGPDGLAGQGEESQEGQEISGTTLSREASEHTLIDEDALTADVLALDTSTVLVQIKGLEINGLIQSLRRLGYVVFCDEAPEGQDHELSDKADAFLHFLDI